MDISLENITDYDDFDIIKKNQNDFNI